MRPISCMFAASFILTIASTAAVLPNAYAGSQAERGKYLVTIGGCNDCHTPGYFLTRPDMTSYLGGPT